MMSSSVSSHVAAFGSTNKKSSHPGGVERIPSVAYCVQLCGATVVELDRLLSGFQNFEAFVIWQIA